MDSKKIVITTAAIVTTLLDAEKDHPRQPVPASTIYIALGMDMDAYTTVTGALERMGWIKLTSMTIALTNLGREKAKLIDEALTKATEKKA